MLIEASRNKMVKTIIQNGLLNIAHGFRTCAMFTDRHLVLSAMT